MIVTVVVFAVLIGYWYAIHRAAQAPSWGRVRKTDFEIACERFASGIDRITAAFAVLLAPAVRRAGESIEALSAAIREDYARDPKAQRRRRLR